VTIDLRLQMRFGHSLPRFVALLFCFKVKGKQFSIKRGYCPLETNFKKKK